MEGFVFNRAIAQLVARDVRDVEVAGSNPVCPTIKKKRRIFLEMRLFLCGKSVFLFWETVVLKNFYSAFTCSIESPVHSAMPIAMPGSFCLFMQKKYMKD